MLYVQQPEVIAALMTHISKGDLGLFLCVNKRTLEFLRQRSRQQFCWGYRYSKFDYSALKVLDYSRLKLVLQPSTIVFLSLINNHDE